MENVMKKVAMLLPCSQVLPFTRHCRQPSTTSSFRRWPFRYHISHRR
jgi:hypothetical protein